MLDGGQSANIELDALRKTPVTDLPYIETIDHVAFENELRRSEALGFYRAVAR